MAGPRRFPIHPANPQRVCWGCDRYCAADEMACGNGSVRTPHPSELFGDDWAEWGPRPVTDAAGEAETALADEGGPAAP